MSRRICFYCEEPRATKKALWGKRWYHVACRRADRDYALQYRLLLEKWDRWEHRWL